MFEELSEPINPKLKDSAAFNSACDDLERYFQKSAARNQEDGGRRGRSTRGHRGLEDDSSLDTSNYPSMDNSRASSVENEVSSLSLNENSKKSYSEDDDVDSGNDPADMIRPKIRRAAGRKSARALPKKLMVKIIKQNSLEEGDLPDSNSSTPPLD